MKETTEINATVAYLENGMAKQKKITGATEQEMLEKVFWFQAEFYPEVRVKQVTYQGKTIDWEQASTYAHYWLGKGRISFEQFKEACFAEPEIVTS